MRKAVETLLGCSLDDLRIVYEFRGDKSKDFRFGETQHWSQRHNPFLGKGFNGARVLECITSLTHVQTWYAKVWNGADSSSSLPGVMFSLFNEAQHTEASDVKGVVRAAYAQLSRCTGNAPVMFQDFVDLEFELDGVSFSSLWGASAVENKDRQHLFHVACMLLSPACVPPYDCCEMHRCVSYVSSPTVKSASVLKPYWLHAPLTWLDAACGVHDDEFYYTERGERFKAVVPSALTELETAVAYASQFRCGSDAHLRILHAFKKAPQSCLTSFFNAEAYYLTGLGSLLIAWSSRNKTPEDVNEMVDFLKGLLPFIPASRAQVVLSSMYTRFESEWQCSTALVVTTTILRLSARIQTQLVVTTALVLRCAGKDVQQIVESFLDNRNALIDVSGTVTRLLTMSDTYITSEPWWYSVVLDNMASVFQDQGIKQEERVTCSVCCTEDLALAGTTAACENFDCVVRNWRCFIDEPMIRLRFDVVVKALGLGANPFWYFQVPSRCLKSPPHTIDPLELIVMCAIASMNGETVCGFWKTYSEASTRNVSSFVACLNNWSPLRVGFTFAVKSLEKVIATQEDTEEIFAELHGRWEKVMKKCI